MSEFRVDLLRKIFETETEILSTNCKMKDLASRLTRKTAYAFEPCEGSWWNETNDYRVIDDIEEILEALKEAKIQLQILTKQQTDLYAIYNDLVGR